MAAKKQAEELPDGAVAVQIPDPESYPHPDGVPVAVPSSDASETTSESKTGQQAASTKGK